MAFTKCFIKPSFICIGGKNIFCGYTKGVD